MCYCIDTIKNPHLNGEVGVCSKNPSLSPIVLFNDENIQHYISSNEAPVGVITNSSDINSNDLVGLI